VDAITAAALSVKDPILETVGRLFNIDLAYAVIVAALLLIGERKDERRLKIASSMLLAFLLGMAVKAILAEPRPCAGLPWCPDDYSFPSLHAVIAFTLMSGFIKKRGFPLYLLFALLVSFTRMNIGVHTFMDIAGALPVALIAYYLTDLAAERIAARAPPAPVATDRRREVARQVFHIAVGLGAIAVLLLGSRGMLIAAVFTIIIVGLLLINLRLQGHDIPIVSWFEEKFERADAPLPGWGSACYAAGVLLAVTFLPGVPQIAAVIFVLAFGDGVSTIVGIRGKARIPYNRRKTVEGFIGMLLSSLPAYLFIGPPALGLAIIAALAESIPAIDDNITIPIACTAFLMII
jgi:dolichol kinase